MPVIQRRGVGNARFRIDARHPLGEQAVTRHREEDARLAVLEDQQNRRHRNHRAERDDRADARVAGQLERARQRVRDAKLGVGHHAGDHRADHHVDDRADRQAAKNADRQVALRVARLLGRGRDRVEADVGEEHDRRALMDAGEAIRRKRRVVGGSDVHHADADEERQHHQLDHHHDRVGGRALARAAQQQPRDQHDDARRPAG